LGFGDILEKWERGSRTSSSDNSRDGKNSVMENWLRDGEIYDKDADMEKTPAPGEQRRRLLRSRPDDTIDIHGLTSEEAQISLDNFFTNAKNSGFKKLRIIHGKGNHSKGEAVLGRTVRDFIEKCPFAGESGSEVSANGGSGATWVFLKK
jgi:DNA-nicking Smr family endonuclease